MCFISNRLISIFRWIVLLWNWEISRFQWCDCGKMCSVKVMIERRTGRRLTGMCWGKKNCSWCRGFRVVRCIMVAVFLMILGRSEWSLCISISCIQWWLWNCLIFYPKCSHRWNWYDCSKGASKNSSNTMISLNIKPWFRSNKTHCYKPAHAHKTKTNLSSSPNYLYPS